MASDALLDLVRHHMWATTTLIEACRELSDEQLTAPGHASFGSILETLNHFIGSDAHYMCQLGGRPPTWSETHGDVGLDQLASRADDLSSAWESFLAADVFEAGRGLVLPEDEGVYRTHAGIVLAQVLFHATAHREQVCTMLTALGIEPPDTQPWAYADATGLGAFATE